MSSRKPYLLSLLLVLSVAGGPTTLLAQGKIWVGQAQELEELLEIAEVTSMEELGVGANKPKKLTVRQGDRILDGLWKPIQRGPKEWAWESYQAEVAAYQMDRMLGLNMVPPTVVREIRGQRGSLQLWVDGCRLYEEVADEVPQTEAWEHQQSRMRTFDNLIGNWDRNPRNLMLDQEWNVVLIDHSQAFLSSKHLDKDREKWPDKFDRRLVERLKDLDLEHLRFRFGRLLLEPQIEAITVRRDALLAHLQKLIANQGEETVLFP